MSIDRERDTLDRPSWPELLLVGANRARREEVMLGLFAGVGCVAGLLLGAGMLVWASAPPPLLRPADGLLLLARLAVVVPVPVVLGGRLALQLGEQLLRWVRHS
jgi:hypothetical protein